MIINLQDKTAAKYAHRPREKPPPPAPPPQTTKQWPGHAREPTLIQELLALLAKIAVIIAAALLLFNFVYGLHYNADHGMYPSLKDGDLVMYYRWNKDYHAQDLLILAFQGEKQVRRVIATAGDTVDIREEGLIINGALQQEMDIHHKTQRYAEGIEFPLTLAENEVFVLGDAREGVTDSRIYGAIKAQDTLGSVIALLRRRNL
ncbi:MAG: signal peptidase I [Firmicutes bacterium]|nr:signal peptidase I [Bacillota bacterium]